MKQLYVWYAGYGSNLYEERFLYYIRGGKFKWGGGKAKGCSDKTLPSANKPIQIPHRLYFAKMSPRWGNGGVAFISPDQEPDANKWTRGRMWKITCNQYEEIRIQESISWYNHEICLGEEEAMPIRTITNREIIIPYNRPSEGYLKTIMMGLKEAFCMTKEDTLKYLLEKDGIRCSYTQEQLNELIETLSSHNG